MEKVYRETKALLMLINDLISKLDKSYSEEQLQHTKKDLEAKLAEAQTAFDQLDFYVAKEPATRRYDAKMCVDQLKYDLTHFKAAFNQIVKKKEQTFLDNKRRDELLTQTYAQSSSGVTARSGTDSVLNLESDQMELRHNNRLQRTNEEMDRMIDHGENVLGGIQSQSHMLKDVKRKMMNVGNQLGLSNTLIRMIDRRNASDRTVFYGGVIITCIVMVLTIKFLI